MRIERKIDLTFVAPTKSDEANEVRAASQFFGMQIKVLASVGLHIGLKSHRHTDVERGRVDHD
jgi:hypothetical protein